MAEKLAKGTLSFVLLYFIYMFRQHKLLTMEQETYFQGVADDEKVI
jgi:hypothetical protein